MVAAYDWYAIKTGRVSTMSAAYKRTYQRHPVVTLGATVYLLSHLTGHLPQRYDALRRAR